jgi:hypothetical protein
VPTGKQSAGDLVTAFGAPIIQFRTAGIADSS